MVCVASYRIVSYYTRGTNTSNLGTVFVRYAAEPYGKIWHYLWYGKIWCGMERGNEYMPPEPLLLAVHNHFNYSSPVAAFVSPLVSPGVRKILLYSCILDRLCFEWQIVVATPGRLCEVVFDRRRLKLGSVTTLVLDEVDALLRSPYDREVDAIVDAVPSGVCVFVRFFPCFFCVKELNLAKLE